MARWGGKFDHGKITRLLFQSKHVSLQKYQDDLQTINEVYFDGG